MKRFITIVAMLCLLGGVAVAQQAIKQKVAVYVTGDAESGYKKVIGSKLVTGITRSEGYAAVERTADFLAELNKEQDYQMSGAVSDNQIARLGQQFGVRYVLVADISEVFETMFISARMIDVQSAQIINSTETSGIVSNMEGLSKLAECIMLEIVGIQAVSDNAVKQKSVSEFNDLYSCSAPDGYHIATYDEIKKIIKNSQMTGNKLFFPIYIDINSRSTDYAQYFTVKTFMRRETVEKTYDRSYTQLSVACRLITSTSENELFYSYFQDDRDTFLAYLKTFNHPADANHYEQATLGLKRMNTPIPSITPGYVYFVKDELFHNTRHTTKL